MEQLRAEAHPAEYGEAFGAVRAGKNLFFWLVGLVILAQLAAFILVHFVGVLGPADKPDPWRDMLTWVLPATRFLAPAACMMLAMMLLLAVKLSLVGRLGGMKGLIGALLWSVLLLALLAPWKRMFGGTLACGAPWDLGELELWLKRVTPAAPEKVPTATWILFYARFIAYPGIALLVWLIVQLKFAGGYKKMNIPPTVKLEVAAEAPARPAAPE